MIGKIMSKILKIKLKRGRELDIELDYGTIQAIGSQTMVINVKKDFVKEEILKKLKNPVLVVTIEQEKFAIMEALLPGKVFYADIENDRLEHFQEWLEFRNFESEEEYELAKELSFLEEDIERAWDYEPEIDFNEEFDYLTAADGYNIYPLLEDYKEMNLNLWTPETQKENKLNFFYMEEGEFPYEPAIDGALSILEDCISAKQASEFIDFNLDSVVNKNTISRFEEKYMCYVKAGTNVKEFTQKVLEVINVINRDLQKAAKRILEIGDKRIELDIHDEQFLRFDNELYFIDPFIVKP